MEPEPRDGRHTAVQPSVKAICVAYGYRYLVMRVHGK